MWHCCCHAILCTSADLNFNVWQASLAKINIANKICALQNQIQLDQTVMLTWQQHDPDSDVVSFRIDWSHVTNLLITPCGSAILLNTKLIWCFMNFVWQGKNMMSECVVPENIHTPPTEGFFSLNPPTLRKFHFSAIFPSKNRALETPLPLGISVNLPWGGHGYFLELHNHCYLLC